MTRGKKAMMVFMALPLVTILLLGCLTIGTVIYFAYTEGNYALIGFIVLAVWGWGSYCYFKEGTP